MAINDATMTAIPYREFINRNLPLVDRGCTSKALFISRREAQSRVRNGRHQDGSVRPYRCRYCDWWHLGH